MRWLQGPFFATASHTREELRHTLAEVTLERDRLAITVAEMTGEIARLQRSNEIHVAMVSVLKDELCRLDAAT